ncbi:DegT/DnrJ/EryC1/StrS aminotransferase family protein [Mycoplana sp. BE70]|uniref:DegT/DnrJ/EryC1/StrS family aminotransferase n=1 Tax=Mycoplana sp. BE70 TaxID=2817775 RepID=UPI00286D08FB|nr:DegT/DnrJ/EryC1/StrS aminotransferase family protein [Mycoplana sp. BE70]
MLLVSAPIVGAEEKAVLSEVIDSEWLTMGDRVRAFEEAFATMHGAEDAVAVSSCTAALHLILQALGVTCGDEVLVPSLTFVATANAVRYVGADPVFVDIESMDVPLISLAEAEARCTPRTKAVILVHFAGYLPDREAWRAFARRRGLLLIEDAAHAPGLKEAGTFGDAAAFSFYGNKNMTTAEGGAVLTRDGAVREAIRQARAHGMTSTTHQRLNSRTPHYDVTMLGFNYRMDELRAAIGLVQLKQLQNWNGIRLGLTLIYRRLMALDCPSVQIPFSGSSLSACHIMPVLLPSFVNRQDVIDHLRANGIQTTIHYPPVHLLSLYRQLYPNLHLPQTEAFAERELTLPLHPRISTSMLEMIVARLAEVVHSRANTGAVA